MLQFWQTCFNSHLWLDLRLETVHYIARSHSVTISSHISRSASVLAKTLEPLRYVLESSVLASAPVYSTQAAYWDAVCAKCARASEGLRSAEDNSLTRWLFFTSLCTFGTDHAIMIRLYGSWVPRYVASTEADLCTRSTRQETSHTNTHSQRHSIYLIRQSSNQSHTLMYGYTEGLEGGWRGFVSQCTGNKFVRKWVCYLLVCMPVKCW